MAAPEYVPVLPQDRPREASRMPAPDRWLAERPGDFVGTRAAQPSGPRLGYQGPDLGFALALARHVGDRLQLRPGEHLDDVKAGCVSVAMRRASLYGRAPVIYDLELAFGLWGFLSDDPPADVVTERARLFQAIGHDYGRQRDLADRVPEATLRLTPGEVRQRLADWRSLTGTV